MKKLLLPFIFLLAIPFSTSCIHEITFDVVITGSNCTWDEPKKALFGREYRLKIIPDDGYELYVNDGELEVENETFILTLLGDQLYNQKTNELIIPGNYVNSKITIRANAQEKQE